MAILLGAVMAAATWNYLVGETAGTSATLRAPEQTANRLDRIATLRRQKTQARGHTPPHKYEG